MKRTIRSSEGEAGEFYTFSGCDTSEIASKEVKLRVPACWSSRFNVYLDQVPEFEELLSNLLRALIYSGMVNLDRRVSEQGSKDPVWELRKVAEQVLEQARLRTVMLHEVQAALAILPDLDRAFAIDALAEMEQLCDKMNPENGLPVSAALRAAREAMKL